MLGEAQRTTLCNFLVGLETLFKSPTDMATINTTEQTWHVTLCEMERDFPLSVQSFVMHLMHHLPQYIKQYGPPNNFWMYPYERFNKTLSESITNSRYPELSAVKKMEVHWLVTMLESAGFLGPLRSRAVPKTSDLHYMHSGRFKPEVRKTTQQEKEALAQLYHSRSTANEDIQIFHYAKRTNGSTEVVLRYSCVDDPSQREKASLVACHLPQGQFVGQVQYFFTHQTGLDVNELSYVDWIGKPVKCSDSLFFMVRRTPDPAPPPPPRDLGVSTFLAIDTRMGRRCSLDTQI
ncbi:uncharacterized protein LOC117340391 [Pecten maximus]|uniref:uncharacterized protein LOC117340391 n=1 Tax=Pecten maximus TaxID=6579 RepID=UPI0014580224|nr:uncharacterized protein LOC117340391 [Pecten maximus]